MCRKSTLVDEQFSQFNCAQTVISLFASEAGLSETTALRVASGFGGGMARGATCGAVTGALMVIGMKHGHSTPDPDHKAHTKMLVRQFNQRFKETHGALTCRELIGFDTSTPEGSDAAHEAGVFDTHCPRFIKSACDMLEDEFL